MGAMAPKNFQKNAFGTHDISQGRTKVQNIGVAKLSTRSKLLGWQGPLISRDLKIIGVAAATPATPENTPL